MNATAILSLIAELYAQLTAVTEERDALQKQLAEQEPE